MAEKESLPLAALENVIREELASGGSAVINIRGQSMLPLMKEGVCNVRIVPAVFPLKRYEIPLYKRENGQFVLHRVIRVKKDSYVCRGDHQIQKEFPVTEDMIIGVADARIAKGKEKPLRSVPAMVRGCFLAETAWIRGMTRLCFWKLCRLLKGKSK